MIAGSNADSVEFCCWCANGSHLDLESSWLCREGAIALQLNASVGVQEVHLNAVGGKMKRNVVRRKLNEVGGSAGDEGGGEVGLSDIRLEA